MRYGWGRYVSASEKRANVAREMAKTKKGGASFSPVVVAGRAIATSYWGMAWCTAVEGQNDFENRLPRGRTYVRNGSVVDLSIEPGIVRAKVCGSSLYTTTIQVKPIAPSVWKSLVNRHAGGVSSLVDLLQGKLPASLLRELSDPSNQIFPNSKELTFACSCPDWASMCKHVAAALYGVGARLDQEPGLFFRLRGVDVTDLVARGAAIGFSTSAGENDLGDADLSAMFGIDFADAAPSVGKSTKAEPQPVKANKAEPVKAATAKAEPVKAKKAAVKAAAKAGPVKAAAKAATASAPLSPVPSTPGGPRAGSGATATMSELSDAGIARKTIERWLSLGFLQPIGFGRHYKLSAEAEALLAGYRSRAAVPPAVTSAHAHQ